MLLLSMSPPNDADDDSQNMNGKEQVGATSSNFDDDANEDTDEAASKTSEASAISEIKSKAIVKYCATKSPAPFSQLEQNTNLNAPPPNWLRGNFGVHEPWIPGSPATEGTTEHTSFVMANSCLDYVGKVDVISGAENIKSLLKIPYSGAPISMMVHRVGRTLLLDNFDVYGRVWKLQQDDWKYLNRFFEEQLSQAEKSVAQCPAAEEPLTSLVQSSCRDLVPVPPSQLTREDVREKLIFSKFLYHSVRGGLERAGEQFAPEAIGKGAQFRRRSGNVADPLDSSCADEALPSPDGFLPSFERETLWTFEDIRMLIGTDIPIFGGGTRPCVSLRLKDMRKPINVLTGVDYWLDNLMCNVPEVLMCYHLEGIVQKYELVKTEELPSFGGSPFSPELIRDVAQNILSFLKSNATREGHTYWLFKAQDDDVVKLYDLTALCPEHVENMDANPFTLPVAVLMYKELSSPVAEWNIYCMHLRQPYLVTHKVAHNLTKRNRKNLRKAAGTIYRLLNDCLELLDSDKNPQVVGSVHYLLSHLYVTCGSLSAAGFSHVTSPPEALNSSQSLDGSAEEASLLLDDFGGDDSDWFDDPRGPGGMGMAAGTSGADAQGNLPCVSLDVLVRPPLLLKDTERSKSEGQLGAGGHGQSQSARRPMMPNCSNFEDCCKKALEHVYEGLECAEVLERQREKLLSDEEADVSIRATSPIVDRQKPIPLQYQPLSAEDPRILPRAVRKPMATSWQLELTALLMAKAMAAYCMLTECCLELQHSGKALRYAKLALLCCETAECLVESAATCSETIAQVQQAYAELLPGLLKRCGDIHLDFGMQGARSIPKHKQDFLRTVYRDTTIANKAWKLLGGPESNLKYGWCVELVENAETNLQTAVRCYEEAGQELRRSHVTLISELSGGGKASSNKTAAGANHHHGSPKAKRQSSESNTTSLQSFTADAITLKKRMGNAKNELGQYYMRMAHMLLESERGKRTSDDMDGDAPLSDSESEEASPERGSQDKKTAAAKDTVASKSADSNAPARSTAHGLSEQVYSLLEQSLQCFADGIAMFKAINDQSNQALLFLNSARVLRVSANACFDKEKQFGAKEQYYLNRALDMYQSAIEHIHAKSEVHESVLWEYSTTLFTYASQLQDRPPLKTHAADEIERQMCDFMQKSLKLVEQIDSPANPRHDVYVYRLAVIHQKLGSMYNRSYMTKEATNDRVRKVADLHYGKAHDLYKELISECALDFLRAQLEHVAMYEYSAEFLQTGDAAKLKFYCKALQLAMDVGAAMSSLHKRAQELLANNGSFESSQQQIVAVKSGSTSSISSSSSATKLPPTSLPLAAGKNAAGGSTGPGSGLSGPINPEFLAEAKQLCGITLDRLQMLTQAILRLSLAGQKKSAKKTADSSHSKADLFKKAYKATLISDRECKSAVELPLLIEKILANLYEIFLGFNWPTL